MRVACLFFLFALLAALLAKPRPARARPGKASRFAIVRIAVLMVRIAGLQIRMGFLLIRYGALVVLGAIIAWVRRGSHSSRGSRSSSLKRPQARRPGRMHVRPGGRASRLKRDQFGRQCAGQEWPWRGDTAHAQIQVRARQRGGARLPRRRAATA